MQSELDPYLTKPDELVLRNLFHDIDQVSSKASKGGEQVKLSVDVSARADRSTLARLKAINDPDSPDFRPTVFAAWDHEDIPEVVNRYLVQPYIRRAIHIVRHPTDVVFLTHIILYLSVNLPSALWLFHRFTYIHAFAHFAFTFWCMGPFTLMMHNHIHNNGVLAKEWSRLDLVFPYILEPLMGHTWDSYYHHHVKHHHVEGNGPDDLSSTLRYQRDDVYHFLCYVARFLFLIWLELPLYFARKGHTKLALRTVTLELFNYFLIALAAKMHLRAAIFVFILPFLVLRCALMIGNYGQHAFCDDVDPNSDLRSSVTLIDVPSNRFCFNDGYHTAHHLNPRRHWREQPVHFVQSKAEYSEGHALVFHRIDYLMITFYLLRKDYSHLASCLVPIGDQIGKTQEELAAMLRTKTRRFTEDDIRAKFRTSATGRVRKSRPLSVWRALCQFLSSCMRTESLIAPRIDAGVSGQKQQ